MTPAQLDAAIRARQLYVAVNIGGRSRRARVVGAREDDGWLFVAGEPIPHPGGAPWPAGGVAAHLWVPGVGRVSDDVVLPMKAVGESQSLLVAIGLRLHADNGTTNVEESDVQEE